MPPSLARFTGRVRPYALGAGVAVALALALVDSPLHHQPGVGSRPALAAAVAALMAIWWLTEALPIYVTALVPVVAFPLLGVFGGGAGADLVETLEPYVDPYIFLFAGGMGIAAAMQQWDLHRRVALTIMRAIGTDPRRLLASTLAATAVVSLWISNTATAAMMMPIGMAVIAQLERQAKGRRLSHYGMAIMLAVAYGANLGGIGSKIGTAPNLQFTGFMGRLGVEIGFLQFLLVGLPFVLLFLPFAWWQLWRLGRQDPLDNRAGADVVRSEIAALGETKRAEKIVLGVFLAAAALWISSKELTTALTPQVTAFRLTSAHVEAGIAVGAALTLALWRHGRRPILAPSSLTTVPWETLLLLGGGFAMAAAVQKSGLSVFMGEQMRIVADLPPFQQVLLASLMTVVLSAVASNTATIAVMLPVLHDAVSPAMVPTVLFAATIASSCDFALPAGTPPNAIVFGSGYVSIPKMARLGAVLDLGAALLAAVWCWLVVPFIVR